jgi:Predicted membrane protein involved in D-alanine export
MALIPVYILILAFTITIDYFAGIYICKVQQKHKKNFLIISLLSNIGILFVFKYFNFFNSSIGAMANLLDWNYPVAALRLILPVGLSFHTFQSMSYIIEVYRGNQKPEKHFGIYALYVMFYPQLVAGPIERPQNMLHQFHEKHTFDYERFTSGLKLIAWGLFKKVVIADRLAILVNQVYNSPEKHNGMQFVIATIFFSFQIYCDFSGYSEIAIGCARTMGFKLMENFRRPYLANSIAEFWKRWHISLTTWFKDYVYIPLGGNRKRHYRNILIVFLISGLWHGASFTFILWGLINGLYQVIGMKLKPLKDKVKGKLGIVKGTFTYEFLAKLTTFMLAGFAWIFFRANNITNLKLIFQKFLTFNPSFYSNTGTAGLGMDKANILVSIILIVFLIIFELIQEKISMGEVVKREPAVSRWLVYCAMVVIILLFGVYGDANSTQFIYFQF